MFICSVCLNYTVVTVTSQLYDLNALAMVCLSYGLKQWLYDVNNEYPHCENPSCLGEPRCSAWGLCTSFTAVMESEQEQEVSASGCGELEIEEQEID